MRCRWVCAYLSGIALLINLTLTWFLVSRIGPNTSLWPVDASPSPVQRIGPNTSLWAVDAPVQRRFFNVSVHAGRLLPRDWFYNERWFQGEDRWYNHAPIASHSLPHTPRVQRYIQEVMNPKDCQNARWAEMPKDPAGGGAGIGAHLHVATYLFGWALREKVVLVWGQSTWTTGLVSVADIVLDGSDEQTKRAWAYIRKNASSNGKLDWCDMQYLISNGNDFVTSSRTWQCYFQPLSRCKLADFDQRRRVQLPDSLVKIADFRWSWPGADVFGGFDQHYAVWTSHPPGDDSFQFMIPRMTLSAGIIGILFSFSFTQTLAPPRGGPGMVPHSPPPS